jgi:hypothetical protein
LREIKLEKGNQFFRIVHPFLVDVQGVCLVRYFGSEHTATIPVAIETIGRYSFATCETIYTVEFAADCKISSIEDGAFSDCLNLQSITIPPAVVVIDESAFAHCRDLQVVMFDIAASLTGLDDSAFEGCEMLRSLAIPSSVEGIGGQCFASCSSLQSVVFAPDSKLTTIGPSAFQNCEALQALWLPPLVTWIGEACFTGCWYLQTFAFSSPCRLRKLLDLPPVSPGVREIPDSVEVLRFRRPADSRVEYTLVFGRESKLREVACKTGDAEAPERSAEEETGWGWPWGTRVEPPVKPALPMRSFLLVTSRSLKRFRSNLEYDPEAVKKVNPWERPFALN